MTKTQRKEHTQKALNNLINEHSYDGIFLCGSGGGGEVIVECVYFKEKQIFYAFMTLHFGCVFERI